MVLIYLEKWSNNGSTLVYRYKLKNFKFLTYGINTPVTPTPMPQMEAKDLLLIKLEGNSSPVKISWTVKDENENQETYAGIATRYVYEILAFFRDRFPSSGVDSLTDSYKFIIEYGGSNNFELTGVINAINFETNEGTPNTFVATADFMVGTIIPSGYETDPPSQPLNFTATSSLSQKIDCSWTAPQSSGSSAITGYKLQYIRADIYQNDWTTISLGVVTTYQITGLVSTKPYFVRVIPTNTQGVGAKSVEVQVTVV